MTDTTKTTQETSRATSAGPTAAQKAPLPGGEQAPGRQETPQYSNQPAQPSSPDRTRDYESRLGQETFGRTGEIGEAVDQARQTVNDAYQRASRSVNETLGQAKEYSRENPGTATLVAFGVGVGVGVLLASGVLSSGRSRSQRIVPPVMNALSEIAAEVFRR
ncbi:MAG: hypothetical protein ACREEM_02765 [Blastocatellia bacterium]